MLSLKKRSEEIKFITPVVSTTVRASDLIAAVDQVLSQGSARVQGFVHDVRFRLNGESLIVTIGVYRSAVQFSLTRSQFMNHMARIGYRIF